MEYTIEVNNVGPSYARDITIVDELPEGLTFVSASHNGHYIDYDHSIIWSLGDLPDGESIELITTLRVSREVAGGTRLTNVAIVNSFTDDPDDSNTRTSADIFIEAAHELFIPEAFSPNNSGFNDYFVIGGLLDKYPNSSIKIYDRWGTLVFEQDPYENKWDGKDMNNRDLPVGTYYYILKLERGEEPIRSFIYLTR